MTLDDFVDEVEARRKTLVVYASDGAPDVAAYFETRNVTAEHESIPPGGPGGFVVLRDDDGFVGAFALAELATLLSPPVFRPWNRDEVSRPWRALYEILGDTLFAGFDRRQLLGTTREIENRAWRIGSGTLRAGFQSAAAFREQMDVYRRLVTETDLSIHAYVADDCDESTVVDLSAHPVESAEVGRYWAVVFDAAGDPSNACALLAEERDPGSFVGFWTYDPDRVDAMASYLRETYE